MAWTDEHNDLLVREMYLLEPWNYKKGSQQRGNIWEQISDSLNDLDNPKFNVTQKSVRDHYNLLEKQQKRKLREEERASGIAPDHSEIEISIEDIIERFKNKDEEDERQEAWKKEKADVETAKAVEMRQLSMETLAASKKRKAETNNEGEKPKRSVSCSGSETIAYLKRKAEVDAELKREKMKLKKAEAEERKIQQDNLIAQQEALTNTLNNAMAAQQRQQEQLIQQMQVQNAALLTLMQNITKKQ